MIPQALAIRSEIEKRRPSLLILDTLADLFGGDEIKRPHSRQFIGLLRGLAIEFRLTIDLLSHPSQSGMASGAGASGSTAWSNSVRSRLYLERRSASGGDGEAEIVQFMHYPWRDGAGCNPYPSFVACVLPQSDADRFWN